MPDAKIDAMRRLLVDKVEDRFEGAHPEDGSPAHWAMSGAELTFNELIPLVEAAVRCDREGFTVTTMDLLRDELRKLDLPHAPCPSGEPLDDFLQENRRVVSEMPGWKKGEPVCPNDCFRGNVIVKKSPYASEGVRCEHPACPHREKP